MYVVSFQVYGILKLLKIHVTLDIALLICSYTIDFLTYTT